MTTPADPAPLDREAVAGLVGQEVQVRRVLAAVLDRAVGEYLFHDA